MNDFDKVGRFLVKRDPASFLRWVAGHDRFAFLDWIDARRVALPPDADLTCDLVAAQRTDPGTEATTLELMAAARADTLVRALGYLVRARGETPAPGSMVIDLFTAVVVNMTGSTARTAMEMRSGIYADSWLGFSVTSFDVQDQPAAALIARVTAGSSGWWMLGWVPLMRGGGDAATIAAWRAAAERQQDERERRVLAACALTFAELARRQPAWESALRGWGVEKSMVLERLREIARSEGRAEGMVEGVRAMILRQGRAKFKRQPSKKQQAVLDGLTDPAALDALAEKLLTVDSWRDLLGG